VRLNCEQPPGQRSALVPKASNDSLVTRNDRSYRKCAGEDGWGANECGGRRTFDKTVSSKPLAFAADAAPMGIDCFSGTRVRVYGHREGWVIDLGGSLYAAAKLVDGALSAEVLTARSECRHTSSVGGMVASNSDLGKTGLRGVYGVPFCRS